jgi:hypothetical protein
LSETVLSLKESGGGPEIVELDVNDGSVEGIQGALVLAPANPNFLGSRVHHNVVVVSCGVETGNISVHGLSGNLTVLGSDDVGKAGVIRCLHVLVKEEDSIELGVSHVVVVSVVFVVVEIQEVVGVVHASEGVVGEGSPATVNLHSSLGASKVVVNINNVVRELDGITKDKHPWLSEIAHLGRLRVDAGIVDNHDFFTCRDSDL